MVIADYLKVGQAKIISRLWIAIPLFVISYALTKIDFNILSRYFSWANQAKSSYCTMGRGNVFNDCEEKSLDCIDSSSIYDV